MVSVAYILGSQRSLRNLGLWKAAMMLPPPSTVAKAIGQRAGKKGVQTAETAVASGTAARQATPVMQHIKTMGPPQAGETQTSQWFRGQLLGQAAPQELMAGVSVIPNAGWGRAAKPLASTATTMRPTMRP